MRVGIRSLRVKLTVAFLLTSLISVGLVALLIQQFVRSEFRSYVLERHQEKFISDAIEYYQLHSSWKDVLSQTANRQPAQGNNPPPPQNEQNSPPQNTFLQIEPPARFVLVDARGNVVVPFDRYKRGDHISEADLTRGEAVVLDGERIGTVLTTKNSLRPNPEDEAYLSRTNRALGLAAIGAVLAAIIIGAIITRIYTRPIRELTAAVQKMGQGELQQHVPVRSQDELGILASQFNLMSADLARANQLRRQMTADIAHDLRTPLTVIAGYLESLRDGILRPNEERFETMYHEATILQQLVEDLRTLSLADAGELKLSYQRIPLNELLERTAQAYHLQAEQAQIHLQVKADSTLPPVSVDPERMIRVLGNLVSNALRYTPPHGFIRLSAVVKAHQIALFVEDNGSGIDPAILPNIFERFYRGDESRQQQYGESGLGLAIAKSIVEAHGGRISVASTPGKGTRFAIELQSG